MLFGRPRQSCRLTRPFPAPSALAPSFSLYVSENSDSSADDHPTSSGFWTPVETTGLPVPEIVRPEQRAGARGLSALRFRRLPRAFSSLAAPTLGFSTTNANLAATSTYTHLARNSRVMNTCRKMGGAPPGRAKSTIFRQKATSSPRTSTLFREKATFSRRKSTYRMSFHRITKWRFSRETSRAFAGPVPEIAHPERSASPQEPRELRNCCGLAKAWRRAHGIRDTELRPGESTLTESVS